MLNNQSVLRTLYNLTAIPNLSPAPWDSVAVNASDSRPFILHILNLVSHVLADNLPAEIHKPLVDIRSSPRARLVIGSIAPILRDAEGAVLSEVAFVADDDEGDGRFVFDADDLVAKFGYFDEEGDEEDEKEALIGFHVEFSVGKSEGIR